MPSVTEMLQEADQGFNETFADLGREAGIATANGKIDERTLLLEKLDNLAEIRQQLRELTSKIDLFFAPPVVEVERVSDEEWEAPPTENPPDTQENIIEESAPIVEPEVEVPVVQAVAAPVKETPPKTSRAKRTPAAAAPAPEPDNSRGRGRPRKTE